MIEHHLIHWCTALSWLLCLLWHTSPIALKYTSHLFTVGINTSINTYSVNLSAIVYASCKQVANTLIVKQYALRISIVYNKINTNLGLCRNTPTVQYMPWSYTRVICYSKPSFGVMGLYILLYYANIDIILVLKTNIQQYISTAWQSIHSNHIRFDIRRYPGI